MDKGLMDGAKETSGWRIDERPESGTTMKRPRSTKKKKSYKEPMVLPNVDRIPCEE